MTIRADDILIQSKTRRGMEEAPATFTPLSWSLGLQYAQKNCPSLLISNMRSGKTNKCYHSDFIVSVCYVYALTYDDHLHLSRLKIKHIVSLSNANPDRLPTFRAELLRGMELNVSQFYIFLILKQSCRKKVHLCSLSMWLCSTLTYMLLYTITFFNIL